MCGEEISLGCVKGYLKKKGAFIRGMIVLWRHFCCIVCVVPFQWLEPPPPPFSVPLPATLHSLQLDQIFLFSRFLFMFLEICVHQTKTSIKPQDGYLK